MLQRVETRGNVPGAIISVETTLTGLLKFSRDGNGPEETDLTEPLVTFPDPDTPPPVSDAVTLTGGSPSQLSTLNSLNNLHGMSPPISMSNISNMANLPAGQETMKFEQKKMTSASKTKVILLTMCKQLN